MVRHIESEFLTALARLNGNPDPTTADTYQSPPRRRRIREELASLTPLGDVVAMAGASVTFDELTTLHTLVEAENVSLEVGEMRMFRAHGALFHNSGTGDLRLGFSINGTAVATTVSLAVSANASPRKWFATGEVMRTHANQFAVSMQAIYAGSAPAGVQAYGVQNPLTMSEVVTLGDGEHDLRLYCQINTAGATITRHGAVIFR